MKITVSKNLNARIGAANTDVSCKTYKTPGCTLTVEAIKIGAIIDGNPVWYLSVDDQCYYWSGGIEENDFILAGTTLSAFTPKEQLAILRGVQTERLPSLATGTKGYLGSAVGKDTQGGLILAVLLKRGSNSLPIQSINYRGIPVPLSVVFTNTIKSTLGQAPTTNWDADSPLQMGGTVAADGSAEFGTRSVLVRLNDQGPVYLLTCYHVFFTGAAIPSFVKYLDPSKAPIANYPYIFNSSGAAVRKIPIMEGYLTADYDFAVARLDASDLQNTVDFKDFKEFYSYEEINDPAFINTPVFMFGAITRTGQSTIQYSFANHPSNLDLKNNVLLSGYMSGAGDSGAPVVDAKDKLVGFIIGKTSDNAFSLIIPFYLIPYNKNYFLKLKVNDF